jgi:C4-dicarboxylate-specific signal transduction histidine kinase
MPGVAIVRLSCVEHEIEQRLAEFALRQALLNLVLNAAQAIDGHPGHIVVGAHREMGRISISVTDDGPGFNPELLGNRIRAFTTARSQGTGLGLAIVQRFAREIGGQLKLANVYPRGARVTLQLPVEDGLAHAE